MDNKQVICPTCGCIAEVRRVKNGQKLRYMVCKHGHGGLQTRKDAQKWEAEEREPFGVFGELPPNETVVDNANEGEKQPEKMQTSSVSVDHWTPPEETQDSNTPLKPQTSEQEERDNGGMGGVILMSILTILGVGAWQFKKQ